MAVSYCISYTKSMTNTKSTKPGPIEVWLSQPNIEITCTIVREDETTRGADIGSLSMRGAQREITGWLIGLGYEPAGRWQDARDLDAGRPEAWTDPATEVMRQFRPGADATVI
jgi:hypothetical protein